MTKIEELTAQQAALAQRMEEMGDNEPGYMGVYRQWKRVSADLAAFKATEQHRILVEMLDAANTRIAELTQQMNDTYSTLLAMNLPDAEVTRIMLDLHEVSGLNAKRQEAARLKEELAKL